MSGAISSTRPFRNSSRRRVALSESPSTTTRLKADEQSMTRLIRRHEGRGRSRRRCPARRTPAGLHPARAPSVPESVRAVRDRWPSSPRPPGGRLPPGRPAPAWSLVDRRSPWPGLLLLDSIARRVDRKCAPARTWPGPGGSAGDEFDPGVAGLPPDRGAAPAVRNLRDQGVAALPGVGGGHGPVLGEVVAVGD